MNGRSRIKRAAVLLLVAGVGVAGAAVTFLPPGIGPERGSDAGGAAVSPEGAGRNGAARAPDAGPVSGAIEAPSAGAAAGPEPSPATEARVDPAGTRKGQGLYTTYCLGCHGWGGQGGGGPPLAANNMPFETFLAQLRVPRVMMPAIPESDVDAAEARQIYDYLRSVR